MATKAEKAALAELLRQIEDLSSWLDDTAYPRRSREPLQQALDTVCDVLDLSTTCPACDGCGKVANTQDQEPWSRWLALPLDPRARCDLQIQPVLAVGGRPSAAVLCQGGARLLACNRHLSVVWRAGLRRPALA